MAVANQKGGVGKSTTAVSLGAALAETGRRVLVIDLDPQGNASTGLGIRHEAREVTVYDVLAADADIRRAIVETPVPNLAAVPSTIDLAGAEIELVSQFSRELRLRRAIDPLRSDSYDFILLDCPPSLGLLTINALAAAEELIVPIQCEYYALEGLGQLLRNVRLVQQNVNPGLRLSGIVMTMFDPRTKLSEQVVDEVRKFFGDLVYRTIIPRTVRLSEAPGFGQPITVYDPRSRGATSYRNLAEEVASRPRPEAPIPAFDEMPKVVIEPVAPPPPVTRSAPRPPPVTRSAPRPLRQAVYEEPAAAEEPELEPEEPGLGPQEPALERSDAVSGMERASPGASGDAAPRDPVADAATGRLVTGEPGARPDEAARSDRGPSVPESEGQDAPPRMRAKEPGLPEEPLRPRTRSAPPEDAIASPAAVAPEAEARPEAAAEEREVVVIDAYGLDPDATREPEVEVERERRDEDDGRRKRWSLFRRGGRR